MKIYCYEKENYGSTMTYAADDNIAALIASLTDQKTLTTSTIAALRGLGHKVEIISSRSIAVELAGAVAESRR